MKVFINHEYEYDVSHLIKTFTKCEFVNESEAELLNYITETEIIVQLGSIVLKEIHGVEVKKQNSRLLYDVLAKYYNKTNPWGTLVGVRPVKIIHKLLSEGYDEAEIDHLLYERYRIEENKRQLMMSIAEREKAYLDIDEKTVSLYICIPFCPTRCLYCSFPSNDLRKKSKLVKSYLSCLHKEIDHAYAMLKLHGYRVDCIYIGGGTPSILTNQEFIDLFSKLDQYFNLNDLKEFTVEAGRPDTISEEKLQTFSDYFVSRICINPQTMNQKTLKIIGRDHLAEDINTVYHMARKFDFDINMDLILGLPDEDLKDVKKTLEAIVALDPENITIHTLAVKTSSRLKEQLDKYKMTQADLVEQMLRASEEILKDYLPYYMYRQKNMVGNFENVGYAKAGHESLYNIRIIEEKHNILALGAGAVSKKCYPKEDRFERIANIKGLETYIERIDDVIKKQEEFFER